MIRAVLRPMLRQTRDRSELLMRQRLVLAQSDEVRCRDNLGFGGAAEAPGWPLECCCYWLI